MKHLLTLLGIVLMVTSCSKDDDCSSTSPEPACRTVIVYMSGENNLTSYLQADLNEMKEGCKQVGSNENLVVFVDKASKTEKPYIAKITADGEEEKLYEYEKDFLASDADNMEEVLRRCISLCPSTEDYGLVLWGHASGFIIEKDSVDNGTYGAARRAYGVDNGNNEATSTGGKWLNIPSMRKVFSTLGIKWKFIFSDCCNMQNVETAYELRDQADYLIASPAEITGKGAPYNTVVPALFIHDDIEMYKSVCDKYNEQVDAMGGHLPISVIKTNQLNALAQATRQVLPTLVANVPKDDYGEGHIYYFCKVKYDQWTGYEYLQNEKTLYDMNDIMRWGLAGDHAAYQMWRTAFDNAVVYSKISTFWHAEYLERKRVNGLTINEYKDFTVTPEAFGGVNMFFPQTKHNDSPYYKHNELIKQMSWYYAVGWSEVGW